MPLLDSADLPSLYEDLLADQIRAEYQASAYQELRRVECWFDGGRLVLTGSVSTFYLKQMAQSLLFVRFGDSLRIDNHLHVAADGNSPPNSIPRNPSVKG